MVTKELFRPVTTGFRAAYLEQLLIAEAGKVALVWCETARTEWFWAEHT